MRAWKFLILGLVLSGVSCAGPSEEKCKEACGNVANLYANGGGAEGAPREDTSGQEACVRTCLPQDAEYISCLAAAESMKELRECHGVSDL